MSFPTRGRQLQGSLVIIVSEIDVSTEFQQQWHLLSTILSDCCMQRTVTPSASIYSGPWQEKQYNIQETVGRHLFAGRHSKWDTSLYVAGPLSRLPVRADSWCREESPGETIHSLDQLHETTGTSHTCYCLHTHTHTQFNVGGLTILLQLVCHILK